MQWAKKIIKGTYLAIFNILLATALVLNCQLVYKFANNLLQIDKSLNITSNELYNEYARIIDFINNPQKSNLSFIRFTISDKAIFHFKEVRTIFMVIYIFLLLSILLFIIYLLKGSKERKIRKAKSNIPLVALIITVVVSSIIILLSIVNFNYLFEIFHKIIFANDYWLFDTVKDSIILALPEEFFLLCATLILGLSIFFSCLEIIVLKISKLRNNAK